MRKMKDSGVEWIGKIPDNWECKRCKYITSFINGYPFESEKLVNEYTYPVVRISDIHDGCVSFEDCLGVTDNSGLDNYKIRKNDILLAMSGATVGKVGIALSSYLAYINQRVGIIRTKEPSFLFRCLSTNQFIEYVLLMSAGTAQPNVSTKGFGDFFVPYPPLPEQQKIADFLDGKCADIDQIRADIEKQIEILMDYKKSVITEAVTKGLDPKSKMKDSGIEWIGKIPEHWGVDKLKFHLKFRGTKNPGDTIVLSLYRELGVVPKDSRDDNHNKTSEDTSNYRFVRNGDFVINKMKAWQGSVAVSDYEGIVSPAYYVYGFSDDLIFKRYFHYLLRNKSYATEFKRLSGGIRVGQWDLPRESLENTLILLPPISEQKAIAAYLDEKCSEIDATIAEKQKQLKTLEEYKKSLIFEYVTGKKEVPA